MTTYKKYSIKNRKTRKIKLFKGGVPMEDTIKNVAIEKVKESLTDKAGGKQVSILIDFYKKLLKPDDYGQKLDNFNKFYETVNINKNGINMTESVTGVEELLKIFNNELEYIKATDADKENKKKALLSNREKRKAIIIDYGDNGDFNINGEKGAAARPGPGTGTAPGGPLDSGVAPGTGPEDSIKETTKNTVVSNVNNINTIQDAAINELKSNTQNANIIELDDEINLRNVDLTKKITETTNQFITNEELYNLNENIQNKTKEIKEINDTITKKKNEQSSLEEANTKLTTEIENLNKEINNLEQKKINGDLSQKKKTAEKIAINNNKIQDINNTLTKNTKKYKDINTTLTNNTNKYTDITTKNLELIEFNLEKKNILILLHRVYDRLIEELSKNKLKAGILSNTGDDTYKTINANINTIKEKIQMLESGRINKTKLKQASDVLINKMFPKK